MANIPCPWTQKGPSIYNWEHLCQFHSFAQLNIKKDDPKWIFWFLLQLFKFLLYINFWSTNQSRYLSPDIVDFPAIFPIPVWYDHEWVRGWPQPGQYTALQHYNCQWWPGPRVVRLPPSQSQSSHSRSAGSAGFCPPIFGGVSPLRPDGGHGRRRKAGARQGKDGWYWNTILKWPFK